MTAPDPMKSSLDYLNVLAMWEVELMRDAYGFAPLCDCPRDPYHRWNCALTPIWAQTIRDLDCNPWTVVRDAQIRAWNEYLDLMVAWWHDLAPEELDVLHTYLGMTWDEYTAWIERVENIPARWIA